MTQQNRSMTAAAARYAATKAAGPVKDRMPNVGGWTWAVSNTAMAVFAGLVFPWVGAIWGLFAAMRVAQSICWRPDDEVKVNVGLRNLWATTEPRMRQVALALFVLAILDPIAELPGITRIPLMLTPVVLVVLAARSATRLLGAQVAAEAENEWWRDILSTVFPATEKEIADKSEISRGAAGEVIVKHPSANMTKGLADLAALDAKMAEIPGARDWEVDPTSDHTRIVIRPVSDETARKRAARAASGGLLGGIIEQSTKSHLPGGLDLSDLEI